MKHDEYHFKIYEIFRQNRTYPLKIEYKCTN